MFITSNSRMFSLLNSHPFQFAVHPSVMCKQSRGLKSMWSNIVSQPRVIDKLGEMSFDGSFWKKNVAISTAVASSRVGKKLMSQRNCILTENNREFLSAVFATWISGASAVPLSNTHPLPQLKYYLEDSQASVLITDQKNRELAEKVRSSVSTLKPEIIISDDCPSAKTADFFTKNAGHLFTVGEQSESIVLYTSGTTGRPKGVSLTMKNVATQVQAQAKAWHWTSNDVVLHTLPMYHTHGLLNAFLTPLFFGATVLMEKTFKQEEVLKYMLGEKKSRRGPVTVFTGVPTMYAKLLTEISKRGNKNLKSQFQNLRLLMSGSAPLSESLARSWVEATGTVLLERYGSTETGMITTNPLRGQRHIGFVGSPFETVSVRLVNSKNEVILTADSSTVTRHDGEQDDFAELQVSGPSVFSHYINREAETQDAFDIDEDGTKWYKTGDCAMYCEEKKSFKINGRASSDVIKSRGFKISALDVETKLSEHPDVIEFAVLGIPDSDWGEQVGLVVLVRDGKEDSFTIDSLKKWCSERMPRYWVPTKIAITEKPIPRNNMGKINKKELRNIFFPVGLQ